MSIHAALLSQYRGVSMRLPLIAVFWVIAAACQLAQAQVPEPKEPVDANTILGTWKAESLDDGSGRAVLCEDLKLDRRYTFKPSGVISNNGIDPNARDGSYAIDLEASLRRITADVGGVRFTAIYRLNGDDLTVAHSKDGSVVPTEFKADAVKGISVITFRRLKTEKSPITAPDPAQR